MAPMSPQSRWHCYQCNSYFAEPIKSNEDELPLCPNCTSEAVVDRESGSEDGWQSEGSNEDTHNDPPSPTIESNFPGFFNPPSMMGNRTTEPAGSSRNPQREAGAGSGFLGMLGNAFGMTGGQSDDTGEGEGDRSGPTVRTFHFGAPGGGGMVAGGSISFGGPSRITRGPDGRIPLPESSQRRASTDGNYPRQPDQRDGGFPGSVELDFDDLLAGIMGGEAMRPVRTNPGGPVVYTNARPQGGNRGNPPDTIEGMMQSLMMHLMNPQAQAMPWLAGLGGIDQDRLGDYVYTQEGFDQVMERMMEAAGQHNHPPPASETVIEGLPRLKLDQATLESMQDANSSCNICFDEFQLDEEVIRVPCKYVDVYRYLLARTNPSFHCKRHMFHTPCLVPWLKQNGTCPVCRFSLVPDEQARRASSNVGSGNRGADQAATNPFATVLNGLSGLFARGSGPPSGAVTPDAQEPPPSSTAPQPVAQTTDRTGSTSAEPEEHHSNLPPTSMETGGAVGVTPTQSETVRCLPEEAAAEVPAISYTSAIPSDYREMMRRREQEMREQRAQHRGDSEE